MDPSSDVDHEIYRLQSAAAAKRKKILIVVAVVLLPILYWGMGFVSVPDYLAQAMFTNIQVSAGSSPFEYEFKAKRAVGETCRGTVTRFPLSIGHKSTCQRFVDVNGNPMEDPSKR
ncbi:MAG: hypothetical protein ABI193_19140 [Minicystis sp.]